MKLQNSIYDLWCVSKARIEPVYSKKKKKSLLVLNKEKILQFITWLVCVGAAGLEEIKSNKIRLCF